MAKLAFCFRDEEESIHPPTENEIIEITMVAQGARAIINVMQDYVGHYPQGEDDDTLGIFQSVFNALAFLMVPVTDYLFNFAGKKAAPEREGAENALS
jgi:hypothetical protein